jgi:succinate-semialdehyde dehydrogenase/glutarate-semialdehyde dehydrogenase
MFASNQLKKVGVFRNKAFINGNWVSGKSKKVFPIIDPATSKEITDVPDLEIDDAKKAITAAKYAFDAWKNTTAKFRAKILLKWASLIEQNLDDLAKILTLEQGKPITESKKEILYSISTIQWSAEEAKRTYGKTIPTNNPNIRLMTIKQPVGVVFAISAWNYPINIMSRKISAAIAAGCTIIAKPAEDTPLTLLSLVVLAKDAGVMDGVINVITAKNPANVSKALMDSSVIQKVTFTGSTEIGKLLMQQAAGTVKKTTLELGGNAPCIIFEDADLNKAAKDIVKIKTTNAGQVCININRVFAQKKCYEEVVKNIALELKKIVVGNGFDPKTNMGPMINKIAVNRLQELLTDAKKCGSKIICGGKPHKLENAFFEPTLITTTNVDQKQKIASQEIFGPVIVIYPFETEEEVLTLANTTKYGLSSYIYTCNYKRIVKFYEALDFGIVVVNTTDYLYEGMPFGGTKESGIGREAGNLGIEEFLETKSVYLGM